LLPPLLWARRARRPFVVPSCSDADPDVHIRDAATPPPVWRLGSIDGAVATSRRTKTKP